MKRGKKAQIKLSFGMIFSIILIIFFVAFAFFGIKKFLGISETAQIGVFKNDLQEDIDRVWNDIGGSSQPVSYDLPRKVEKVCFVDDENYNLVFVPDEFNRGNLKHLDIDKTLDGEPELCISASNKKVTMTLKKDYEETLVTITE